MPRDRFQHVDTWVFDLDNTLYHPSVRLFDQIDRKMTDYVMRTTGTDPVEADREQVEAACGDGAAAERVDDLGAAGGGGGWRAHRFPPRNWVRKRSSSRWSSWALRSTVMTP